MHPLDPRAVDENLAERVRQRQEVERHRVELDRHRRLWRAGRQRLIVVGAQRLQDQRQIGAQDAVFVEAFDRIERVVDRLHFAHGMQRGGSRARRVEPMLEQLHQTAGHRRMPQQRVFHIALAVGRAGLPQHLAVKPQDRRLAGRQPGCQHQPVEPVILDGAAPCRQQRRLETVARRRRQRFGHRSGTDRKLVDPYRPAIDRVDPERLLGNDPQPQVFEDRQHVRQRHRLTLAVEPQRQIAADAVALRGGARVQRRLERRSPEHLLDAVEIGDCLGRLGARLVGDRERFEPPQPAVRRVLAEGGSGFRFEVVRPAAPGLGETRFERRHVNRRHRAAGHPDDELDMRQRRLVEMRVKIADRTGERGLQDRGEALAQPCVVALARHIDEARDKAFERVALHKQRNALPLLQVEDADRRVEQLVLGDLEEFVAREGFEDVQQRLAVVALGRQPGALDRPPHLLP